MLAGFLAHQDSSGLRRLFFKIGHLSSVPIPFQGILPSRALSKLEFLHLELQGGLVCTFLLNSFRIFSFTVSQLLEPGLSLTTESGQSFLVHELYYKSMFPSWPVENLCRKKPWSRNLLVACPLPYHPPDRDWGGKVLNQNQNLIPWDSFHVFEYSLHFRLGLQRGLNFKRYILGFRMSEAKLPGKCYWCLLVLTLFHGCAPVLTGRERTH